MLHLIAERWAELFSVGSLVDAALEWLCWVLVIGLMSSFGPNRYLRTLLAPSRLVLWAWTFACISSGREFRNHHPTTTLVMSLMAGLCVMIPGVVLISLITLAIGKLRQTNVVQVPRPGE